MSNVLQFRPRYVRQIVHARFVHPANAPVIIVERDQLLPWRGIALFCVACGGTVLVAMVLMVLP